MNFFSKKEEPCSICNKKGRHRVESFGIPLCSACTFRALQEVKHERHLMGSHSSKCPNGHALLSMVRAKSSKARAVSIKVLDSDPYGDGKGFTKDTDEGNGT